MMSSRLARKKTTYKSLLFLLLLVSFVAGCSAPSKRQLFFLESEKPRYEDFFKKFLFLDQAVYTLYGSKPMTEIVLYPGTPEERVAAQKAAMELLSKEDLAQLKASIFEYEEEYWFEETLGNVGKTVISNVIEETV